MNHAVSLHRSLLTIGFLAWSWSAGAQSGFDIVPVLRPGDPLLAPQTLVRVSDVRLSDAGEVVFRGDGGVLRASPDGLIVIAAPGDTSPDGRLITSVGVPSINARGQMTFTATLGSTREALLRFFEGTIETIVQRGDAIPGGGTFRSFGYVAINARGDIAFTGQSEQGVDHLLLHAEGEITPLLREGDPAPGGGSFAEFAGVQLNDEGIVVFSMPIASGALSGVFRITDGQVEAIARSGMEAPQGGVFSFADEPSINARGDVAFDATVTAPGRSGVFMFSNGVLSQVAGAGDVVEADTLVAVGGPSIDAQGQVAFAGSIGAPLTDTAVFVSSGGSVRRLVASRDLSAEGDVLVRPGGVLLNAPGDLVFTDVALQRIYRLTDAGITRVAGAGDFVPATPRLVSTSAVSSRGGAPVFVGSIFPGVSGIVDLAGAVRARIGDAAPGGGTFMTISQVASSEPVTSDRRAGEVAFEALLFRDGLPADRGIFVTRNGRLFAVARTGAPAPGGGTFTMLSGPTVNASGQVAFSGAVSAPGRSGIFVASESSVELAVGVGDLAPSGEPFAIVNGPWLNDAGQLAFFGTLSSGGGPRGIYLMSGQGLTEVIRYSGPLDPPNYALNNRGHVALNEFGRDPNRFPRGLRIALFSPEEGIRDVVRTGDLAPEGNTISDVQLRWLDDNDHVGFVGTIASSGTAAFLAADGNVEIVARPGDPAPVGGTFTGIEMRGSTNGNIVFSASLSTGYEGVFLARRAGLQPEVRIDIRPQGQANRIDTASARRVRVAILSGDGFDPATVIADTVRFGATGAEAAPINVVMRDADGDGDIDMVLRFRIQDTGIQCGQTAAVLTGQTATGHTIAASDAIRTVGCR